MMHENYTDKNSTFPAIREAFIAVPSAMHLLMQFAAFSSNGNGFITVLINAPGTLLRRHVTGEKIMDMGPENTADRRLRPLPVRVVIRKVDRFVGVVCEGIQHLKIRILFADRLLYRDVGGLQIGPLLGRIDILNKRFGGGELCVVSIIKHLESSHLRSSLEP